MAKKHKCIECDVHMNWAMPDSIHSQEQYEYAKQCLLANQRTIVCGQTMKTKSRNHEQYCKYYEHHDESWFSITASRLESALENSIKQLQKEIEKWESNHGLTGEQS